MFVFNMLPVPSMKTKTLSVGLPSIMKRPHEKNVIPFVKSQENMKMRVKKRIN